MANKITVTSAGTSVNVNVTPDSAMFYSNKSMEWAISEKLIDGKDYSSKYYANISKTNALQSAETRELLQGEYNEYSENLLGTKTNALDEINTLTDNSISELQTELSGLRTSASSIVSTSKTDIQNTATSAKNTAISAIQTQQTTSVNAVKTEGTTQVNLAKAQATAAANSATQASNVVKQVEDDLGSKVDIDDMVEVDFADAGSYIAGCAMPSDKFVNLTLGSSGSTYTSPAAGFFQVHADVTGVGTLTAFYDPVAKWDGFVVRATGNGTGLGLTLVAPVPKGKEIKIEYGSATINSFKFVYAIGSESEA